MWQTDQNPIFFFFLKFFYAEKQCGRQLWDAVEREPVRLESSILPRAKRASSETKRKTKRIFFFLKFFYAEKQCSKQF